MEKFVKIKSLLKVWKVVERMLKKVLKMGVTKIKPCKVLEDKFPPLLQKILLKYARIPASLFFAETKIYFLQNCFAPEVALIKINI